METEKQTEIKKSVKLKDTVFTVKVDEEQVSATETTFPMPGYGNNYGTAYSIDITYSKGWAQALIEGFSDGWNTGHGLTAWWTECTAYMRKGEAKKFRDEVIQQLKEAENGTPDVLDVFNAVKQKVVDACHYDDEY